MQEHPVSPIAARVIAKCGGVAKVAEICGRTKSWVYKWTYPKPKGRGGLVPMADALRLMAAAERKEVSLCASDFFAADHPTPTQGD